MSDCLPMRRSVSFDATVTKGVRCAFVFFERVLGTSGDDRITSKKLFTIMFQEMQAKVP